MLHLTNITKSYKAGKSQVPVLKGIDVHIAKGEFVALLGASGSGKSTLMNILGCLDTATSGSYKLNNHEVALLSNAQLTHIRNRDIGFVFQSFNLIPHLSVLENVALPMLYAGLGKKKRIQIATQKLEQLGLSSRLTARTNEFSGGQRQRIAIARALVNNPVLLLADEPTGNLDSTTSAEVMQIFNALHQNGNTIVLVTHEMDVANYAQRKIVIKDGKIV